MRILAKNRHLVLIVVGILFLSISKYSANNTFEFLIALVISGGVLFALHHHLIQTLYITDTEKDKVKIIGKNK